MAECEGVRPEAEQDRTEEPALLTADPAPAADDVTDEVPARGGCRTHLHGWAGAHLHGAVRPRRRAAGRGHPPGRWC